MTIGPLQIGVVSLAVLVIVMVLGAIRSAPVRGARRAQGGSGDVSPGSFDTSSCEDSSSSDHCGDGGGDGGGD